MGGGSALSSSPPAQASAHSRYSRGPDSSLKQKRKNDQEISTKRATKASKAKGKTGPDPVRQERGQWIQKLGLSANPASQSDSV